MTNDTRSWVRLPSGKHLDLLDPQPSDWEDSDLALGLARTFRWGGHSNHTNPLSVAQHSITVMLLRSEQSPVVLSPEHLLRELLHDAEEGFLGFDAPSPLKPFLGDKFRELTMRLEKAIFERYNLPAWTPEDHAKHKIADRVAAASEAVHVAGWSASEVAHTLKIEAAPMQQDPLVKKYACVPWEPWSTTMANTRFLTVLNELKELCLESKDNIEPINKRHSLRL
jgi:hypothetical protein